MSDDRGKAWFVPKTYGYGATPWSWQGWSLVAGFVGAILVLAWILIVQAPPGGPGVGRIALFFVLTGGLAVVLSLIARARTDGEWRWRWGGKDEPRP